MMTSATNIVDTNCNCYFHDHHHYSIALMPLLMKHQKCLSVSCLVKCVCGGVGVCVGVGAWVCVGVYVCVGV